MLRKLLLACALLGCQAAVAGVIEYKGYSRDASSQSVIGGGLEWMQWDATLGMSVNHALATYAKDGWVLASNVQVAALYNTFMFGNDTDRFADGNKWKVHQPGQMTQATFMDWQQGEDSPHSWFLQLFGYSRQSYCLDDDSLYCALPSDPFRDVFAIFGDADPASQALFVANISDDVTSRYSPTAELSYSIHYAQMYNAWIDYNGSYAEYAVALVRPQQAKVVAAPGTIALLLLGVACSCRRRLQ